MENKIFSKIFDKILNNTENLDSVEKTTIISIYLMVIVYSMIHVFFLVFFIFENVHSMIFVNSTSIIICLINLHVLLDVKKLATGLILWVSNSCYYMIASIYILGYDKNPIIFLPVLLLLIHVIFPKQKKYLVANTLLVVLTYFLSIYLKFNKVSKYNDMYNFIEVINTFSALVLATLIIFLKSKTDALVNAYTSEQLDGLAEEVDNLTIEANIDFLTGLWNRRYIEKELSFKGLPNGYFILADIDFFKKINDNYGHLCGDYVLKEVAKLLQNAVRNIDCVCRWGGEEFLLIIKTEQGFNVSEKLERTKNAIEQVKFEYNGEEFNITITFGYTQIDRNISFDQNIHNADSALYYGKNNGRNCIHSFLELNNN